MSFDIDPDALASALPAGITYETAPDGAGMTWNTQRIAQWQAERLAEAGYRLVHDEHGDSALARPETLTEHTADALAKIHDAMLSDTTEEIKP